MQLLRELQPHATELLRQPRDAEADRMQAYWAARRLYLEFGATVRPVADPGEMLQRVQKPLMGLLRQSPEFRPACEPLVAMANALRGSDPARAAAVTAALEGLGARCAQVTPATTPAS
jgi:spermidine synthase